MGLQSKLILPIVVLITLLVGATGYLSYRTSETAMREDTLDAMRGEAEAARRAITGMMEDGKMDVRRTAGDGRIVNFFNGDTTSASARAELLKLVRVINDSYPHYDSFDVINAEGLIIASSDPAHMNVKTDDNDFFRTAMRGETRATNPFVTETTSKTVIAISSPVTINGKNVGVVLGTLLVSDIFNRFVKPIRLGESGSAFLMSSRGHVVAHQNPKFVFDQTVFNHPTYQQIPAKGNGLADGLDINNNQSLFVFAQDPESGMIVVVRAITDEIFAPLTALRNNTLMVIAVSAKIGRAHV